MRNNPKVVQVAIQLRPRSARKWRSRSLTYGRASAAWGRVGGRTKPLRARTDTAWERRSDHTTRERSVPQRGIRMGAGGSHRPCGCPAPARRARRARKRAWAGWASGKVGFRRCVRGAGPAQMEPVRAPTRGGALRGADTRPVTPSTLGARVVAVLGPLVSRWPPRGVASSGTRESNRSLSAPRPPSVLG